VKDSAAYVVVGFATTFLGPVLGPFALLLFGAVVGSLLPMSKAAIRTRWEGVRFILVSVAIALSLTGLAVWVLERHFGIPGNLALLPMSFVIAAGRDQLLVVIERLATGLGDFLAAVFTRRG